MPTYTFSDGTAIGCDSGPCVIPGVKDCTRCNLSTKRSECSQGGFCSFSTWHSGYQQGNPCSVSTSRIEYSQYMPHSCSMRAEDPAYPQHDFWNSSWKPDICDTQKMQDMYGKASFHQPHGFPDKRPGNSEGSVAQSTRRNNMIEYNSVGVPAVAEIFTPQHAI